MIKDINGEITGEIADMNSYYIRVAESTEEELESMCKQLEAEYKDEIALVKIHYVTELKNPLIW